MTFREAISEGLIPFTGFPSRPLVVITGNISYIVFGKPQNSISDYLAIISVNPIKTRIKSVFASCFR
jgi:hypothetical protein